jgi:hypothetical protein
MSSQTDNKVNDENIVFNNFINEDVENDTKQQEVSKEFEDRENFIDSAIKIATETGSNEKKDEKKKHGKNLVSGEEAGNEGKIVEKEDGDVVNGISKATETAEAEVDVSEPKPKKAKLSDSKKINANSEKKSNEPTSDVIAFNKKKRNRKVLSCQKCRKDKQACSRVYPCTRCAKKDFECKFVDNITQEEFYPKADDLPKANPSASKKQKVEDKKEATEDKKADGADIEKETAEAVLAASAAVEAEKEVEQPVEEAKEDDDKDQIDSELKQE